MAGERQPRGPGNFRQRDLTTALKALKAAGTAIERIEIGKGGGIVIIPSRENAPVETEANEWDEGE